MVVAISYYDETKDSVLVRQNLAGFVRLGKKVSFLFLCDDNAINIETPDVITARQLEELYQDKLKDKENHIFWFSIYEDGSTSWGVEGENHG